MRQPSGLVPLLATVVMAALLVGLGVWQMERRAWKHDLIAALESRIAADPTPLPARIDDPAAWDLRRVALTGRFVEGRDILLSGRPRQGWAGYEIVSLFERADGGPPVLVNRGFVPLEWRDPAARSLTKPPADAQTIVGFARPPMPRRFMEPDNDPAKMGAWVWVDLPAVAAALGVGELASMMVDLQTIDGAPPPGQYPQTNRLRADLPDNHLLYALTWWALAAAMVAIYILWRRLQRRAADKSTDAESTAANWD